MNVTMHGHMNGTMHGHMNGDYASSRSSVNNNFSAGLAQLI
jgi:hypothetical protein